ncbi:hypothetical protein [Agriterribacter sp.]|uniref:hypothetical protein n=1 Tax=Agriterribacter sp. TaxID=2821509 RepID=UPI002CF10A97|nr:hypothetical protein [Agriterribacter sp.]HRO46359.1 hypothetical protein [Agriterribacter sp.]HRQ17526.1 hypothetical protein [Agriterribacter sp.]
MHPRKFKYFLIAGVALVWGIIIYRIIRSLSNETPVVPVPLLAAPTFNYTIEPDTFFLFADYPDPFLPDEENSDTGNVSEPKPITNTDPGLNQPPLQTAPADSFDPSIIKYTGMIANPEMKIRMAIIKINEREVVLKEKGKTADFTLQKILKDKIIIMHKSKRYEVLRDQ